jgi:hypothetical protein
MNDDWLVKGIRKQKQEAIWQSTFSFPPLYSTDGRIHFS